MTACRPCRRASLPSLGGTSVALVVFAPGRTSAPPRPGVGVPVARAGRCRGNARPSQVLGEPRLSVCACSPPTPAGPLAPDPYSAAAWPWVIERQRLLRKDFRRSRAWLSDSLSTLRSAGYPAPRKTRFRPLVRRYRAGFPPARFRGKVSDLFPTSHPPFPSFLGATDVAGARVGVPAGGAPGAHPQGGEDLLPGAVGSPGAEVVVGGLPGDAEVVGEGPPGAALAGMVEQGVEHLAHGVLAGTAAGLGRRDEF